MTDTTAPVLTSLDLPEIVDLSNGDVPATFNTGASDSGGIRSVVISYDRAVSYDVGTRSAIGLYSSPDEWTDGESITFGLLSGNAPGLVSVSTVVVTDLYGNERTYTKSQLDALGFDSSFTISGSVADTTAPVLTSLDLPEIVDLSNGDVPATFNTGASDSGGIRSVVISYDRAVSYDVGTRSAIGLYSSPDEWTDGESITFGLLSGNAPGLVSVSTVVVTDLYGNERTYTKPQLDALGFNSRFTISGSVADTTAPVLTSLDLPEIVDLSNGDVPATFNTGASDSGGIRSVVISYDRAVSYDVGTRSAIGLYSSPDEWTDGESITFGLLSGNAPGLVSVSTVVVTDLYGNERTYTKPQLDALGFDSSFTISNALTEVLAGTAEPDYLVGDGRRSIVYGFGGDDWLEGGTGSDEIDGGEGRDTAYYINSTEGVTVSLTGGVGSGGEAEGDTLHNIERLRGSDYADNLTGSAGDDYLLGGPGNDHLDGGIGADWMDGGAGDDVYMVDNAGDLVDETGSDDLTDIDTVQSLISFSLANSFIMKSVEHLTLLGTGNINGTGNDLSNVITGNAGINALSGGAGADTMRGEGGNDIYVVDNAGDEVIEGVSSGTDTVHSTISYTLGSNLEDLALDGTAKINATGNGLKNLISGNSAANTLGGLGGNDTLYGGDGNDVLYGGDGDDRLFGEGGVDNYDGGAGIDTIVFTPATDRVTVDLTQGLVSGQGPGAETMVSIENVEGSDWDDTLIGSAVANSFYGYGGNDRFDGAGGTDFFDGGDGTDTVVYSANTTPVVINLATGAAAFTGKPWPTETFVSIENAIAGSGDDTLLGNSGANQLDGSGGADTMRGEQGNDKYIVNNVGDKVVEGVSAGRDAVYSTITYTLGANLEDLTLNGTAKINATGNGLNNLISGNTAVNTLRGLAGNDTFESGAGADILIGGAGADVFRFLGTVGSTAAAHDIVRAGDGAVAFEKAGVSGGDRFDFAAIDADEAMSGVQNFKFGTSKDIGCLWAVNSGNLTLIRGNTDTDAPPEIEIAIEDAGITASAYKVGDFILV